MPPDSTAYFSNRRNEVRAEFERLSKLTVLVSRLRVATVLLAFALLIGRVFAGLPEAAMGGAGASVLAFVGLALWHAKVHAARDVAEARVAYAERALLRCAGNAKPVPPPIAIAVSAEHPFADDLDVIAPEGAASLWNLLDPAPLAADAVKARLVQEGPADLAWISSEQEAVRELEKKPRLAEDAYVFGREVKDFAPLDRFLKDGPSTGEGAVHPAAGRVPGWLRALSYLVPLANVATIALSFVGVTNRVHVAVTMIVSMVLGLATQGILHNGLEAISAARDLGSYEDLFRLLEKESFSSAKASAASAVLRAEGSQKSASEAMASLSRILGFAQARENEVFKLIIGPLFAWDVHCVVALERFRDVHGTRVKKARDTLIEFVTWATLGRLAFEQSGFSYPTFDEKVMFDAEGLAHPLLDPNTRVTNSVHMAAGASTDTSAFLVITGSNMAGKSTLLRALGLAVVLARAGAPVCAQKLTMGPLSVVASLRVRDSVGDGVSRFYAELRKVKRVLDTARTHRSALCLLDEVFSGTNARERLLGAEGLLGALAETGSIGAVCTHDLELGNLERAHPGVFRNVHFEEQVEGDVMRFDYKIRPGVVSSSNALALMRAVGIDVV